jgi:gliding motility-associated-like protein
MKKYILIILLIVLSTFNLYSQIVGSGTFIKGTSVEIGINNNGGYEGTSAIPPFGMHPRGGFGLFGFVANPQVNAWATFYGDYFTPGSPENGWGLLVGNSSGSPAFSNNCASSLAQISSTPTITYSHILNCYNVNWMGSVVSGTTNIKAKINYFLEQNQLFYTTTISLTNNSASTIPTLYYYRNVDPDNNQPVSGSFVTNNLIEDQPTVGLCNIACVSASQIGSVGVGTSYLAFAAVGPDFRVCYGGFSNRNAFNLWNGVGFTQTVGSTNTADQAISLSYKIQNFLPGETRTFKFVTILKSTDKLAAINNLLALTFPGSAYVAPSLCSPLSPPDTAHICGPTVVGITGSNVGAYNWSWLPTTALSSSTTFSAVVNPTITTTYTIIGIPTSPCTSTVPISYTVVVIPAPPLPTTISPSITACFGSTKTLTITSGGIGSTYSWVGPGGFTSTTQNPTLTAVNYSATGTYTALTTLVSGCTYATLVYLFVTPVPTLTISASSFTACVGQPITLGTITTATYTLNYTWSNGLLTPTIVVTPSVTTSYAVTIGLGTCVNTSIATITIIPTPTLTASSATICNGNTATLTVLGATTYTWSTGSYTNNTIINPTVTTTYSIIGANGGTCLTNTTAIVTVINYPTITSSLVTNLRCNGDNTGSINISALGATNYSWLPSISSSNIATGLAAGTYTCILTIAPSCSISSSYTVNQPTSLIGSYTKTNTTCGSCNGFATASASGGTYPYNYLWSPSGSTMFAIGMVCPSTYTLTTTDSNSCTVTQLINILPSPVFVATVTALSTEIYQGMPVSLEGLTGVSYQWYPKESVDCDTCSIVKSVPFFDTEYCVTITSVDGCVDDDCITVKVLCGDVFVPNAFSPNNDGHNDVLLVYGNCIQSMMFRVFDRWGEVIFENNNQNTGWDGVYMGFSVMTGVYVYVLKATFINGEHITKTGNITVVK